MDSITRRDLELFRTQLMSDFKELVEDKLLSKEELQFDWLRSKTIRKMMNISPATLQNLRIKGNYLIFKNIALKFNAIFYYHMFETLPTSPTYIKV